MPVFDASSMIYAWDNYPIGQFPPLWDWMQVQVEEERLVMPRVAFEEVEFKAPDCADLLSHNDLVQLEINNQVLQTALRINNLLGIVGDRYTSGGVDENDILIIASACVRGELLVSNEEKQIRLPQNIARYKIPAVCAMTGVSVPCLNFIEYIRQSGAVFR
jgi:hypothetical protein